MSSDLDEFAERYAQAWCSRGPESVASLFAADAEYERQLQHGVNG